MAFYKFLAAAKGQKPAELEIEAENTAEARRKLKSRNLTPIRYLGESDSNGAGSFFSNSARIDVIYFTSELAPLLKANIPLERALAIMAEGCEDTDQKNCILTLRQGLHEGKKLSAMIRSYGTKFPGFYANLIESGEESGALDEILEKTADYYEEEADAAVTRLVGLMEPLLIVFMGLAIGVCLAGVFPLLYGSLEGLENS
jgi:type II secretory pathway component PulF